MKRVLLFNPPVGLFQRGEDRCQAEIEGSSATTLRPPIDLAGMAAVLRQRGCEVALRDFPAERVGWEAFEAALTGFRPDAVVMSTTTATLEPDMEAFQRVKARFPSCLTVAKGAHFYSCEAASLSSYAHMDFALRGEADFIIGPLWDAFREGTDPLAVPGLHARAADGIWRSSPQRPFDQDLDSLPFSARDLLRNELYVRPDTDEPQTTIQVARGCPAKCTYCLSPVISGNRARHRSAASLVAEVRECVERHGIRDFFFRADLFTVDKRWVLEVCQALVESKLNIRWVANSRVDTIDEERLGWMKKAGCWLIAYGIESGDAEIQKKIKKCTTPDQARKAVALTHAAGIKTFGFFMIGLPWDTRETVQETLDLALEVQCDFLEIHIAVPYEGSPLYEDTKALGLIQEPPMGHTFFTNPPIGTLTLSVDEVKQLRRSALRKLYMNPRYIWRTLRSVSSPRELYNYSRYGARLAQQLMAG